MTQSTNILRVEGEMTIYTAASLKQQLDAMLAESAQLEIELSQVSEIDTAGLQLLILAKKECTERGGRLQLVGHSQPVLDVLDLCNMANFFGDPLVIPVNSNRSA